MKIIGLTLGLLIPLLVCSSPINNEGQASGIHIFLDERGALVDEEIEMDKEHDIMVVNVPAHHDLIESKTLYDMKSTWMMQVLPILKECHYMRRPSALNDVHFDDVENIETSSKEKPIKVGLQNTIKLETSAMVGPKRNRSILPESFQPHCPQDFDVRSTHLYEIGKKDFYGWDLEEIQIGNQAPTLIGNHTRRKRSQQIGSQASEHYKCEMFGQASDKCNHVVEAKCGSSGQCSLANLLYNCEPLNGRELCNYLAIPCSSAFAQGTPVNTADMAWCLLHMTTRNEHCKACCRDEKCRGSKSIDFCQDTTDYHGDQWAPSETLASHADVAKTVSHPKWKIEGQIRKINVKSRTWDGRHIIQGIQVFMENGETKAFGMDLGDTQRVDSLEVPVGERIKEFVVRTGWYLDAIGFRTDKGKTLGLIGGNGGALRNVEVHSPQHRMASDDYYVEGIQGITVVSQGAPCICEIQFKYVIVPSANGM